jgi:putative hemolysin
MRMGIPLDRRPFQARRLGDVVVPRDRLVCLDVQDDEDQHRRILIEGQYDWYPLVDGGLERIIGIVHAKDVLSTLLADGTLDLRAKVEPASFLYDRIPLLKAYELMSETGCDPVVVIDRNESVIGASSRSDLVDAIVREAVGPEGDQAGWATQRPDGSWLIDGLLSIGELKQIIGVDHLPEETRDIYKTAAGLVLYLLKHVPAVSESCRVGRWTIEVVDMDGQRIDKLLLTPDRSESSGD